MKKKIVILMGVLMVSASMIFTGCGTSKSVSSKNEKETGDETTKKKNVSEKETEDETEEETTKKKNVSEKETTEKKSSASHDDWTEYSGTGYTISLSDDWTEAEVASTELAFTHAGTSADGFAENINTITQDISAYNMDLEKYKELSLQQYEQIGYDLIDIKSMEVDGEDGYYVTTSVEESGITCYIAQWFTVIDDTAYIFTFAADEDGFDELEDEVIEIFETIEFE